MERTRELKLPARASLWNIASAFIARGVGAIGTPIFTRLLSVGEYGLYPLYTTWLGVVSALATLGLAGGAIYRGLQRYGDEKGRFISAAVGLFFSLFIPLGIVFLLISPFAEGVTGLSPLVVAMLLSEILFSTVTAFASARARYEYKYKSLALVNIISALGSPLIAILFILYTPYRSEGRILGAVISSLLIALPQLYVILARCERLYDKEIWRYLLKMALPLLPHLLGSTLIVRIGEMVIAGSHGEAELGKYSVAMSVGLALSMVSGGIGQVISPWILRKLKASRHGEIREVAGMAVRAMSYIGMLISALAPEILILLTPPEYRDVLPAIYPLIASSLLFFISQTAMAGETYYERPEIAAMPTALVAVVTVSASILFIPLIDYRISSLFTLAAYLLLMLLNLANYRTMSGEKMLHGGTLLGALAVFSLFVFLMFIFREVWLSRLIFSIAIIPKMILDGIAIYKKIKE